MIRTGEQYLESVRDGRRVLCGGEMIDDITTHPKTRGYAQAIAEYYDMHHDPEHQDVMTFVDENGERWAKHWFLPRNKEDLVARREYHDYLFRHWARGAMFTRPPASMLPVFYTLYQDPEPWESESRGHDGRPLADNIRNAWETMKSQDLSASPMFLDVQGDRSDPDSVAETPMLRMVDKNDEGIVVRGWKAIGTGVAFANNIFMGVLWKPGAVEEQIVFALVPANDPGVTHVVRPSLAQPDADPFDRPLASRGDELDGMAYFDDVLIPWDRVFHIGNPDHAKFYPQRLFDWIHAETQIRHVVNAEMIAGLGVLITEALGTAQAPIVASQVADLIRFRETCRAFTIAAEETGFMSPGGLYKPNNIFVDFGRAYYLENVHKMIEILIDFCGRGVVVYPTKADLDNPELGGALRAALRGHNTSAEDRTKIFRMIHERFLSEWGARHAMFEKFNGTPLWVIKLLTMQRVEYQADGPLTELARQVCGLEDVSGLAERANEEKADYPSIRVRPDYIKQQDVATTQDVEAAKALT
ncbi:MAG TPA: 4-hydroxyphenylacetate 3-hydroxylase N-terminal domain-containing protein [Thermoleophilaceae bacterium]